MNYLCLLEEECEANRAVLSGPRAEYVAKVHNCKPGEEYSAVVIARGHTKATVVKVSVGKVELELQDIEALPLRNSDVLIVGVCRPQTVKKIIHSAVSYSIGSIFFLASSNSEKSYFQSSILNDSQEQFSHIVQAIEQSGCPVVPSINLKKHFKPFVEDELPSLLQSSSIAILANSCQERVSLAIDQKGPRIYCIGPEKGWTDYEKKSLLQVGFKKHSFGYPVLRTELAATSLLAVFQAPALQSSLASEE